MRDLNDEELEALKYLKERKSVRFRKYKSYGWRRGCPRRSTLQRLAVKKFCDELVEKPGYRLVYYTYKVNADTIPAINAELCRREIARS